MSELQIFTNFIATIIFLIRSFHCKQWKLTLDLRIKTKRTSFFFKLNKNYLNDCFKLTLHLLVKYDQFNHCKTLLQIILFKYPTFGTKLISKAFAIKYCSYTILNYLGMTGLFRFIFLRFRECHDNFRNNLNKKTIIILKGEVLFQNTFFTIIT